MPLTLRYTAAELADNTGFDITDATGSYSASNTGGFGAPNPVLKKWVSFRTLLLYVAI